MHRRAVFYDRNHPNCGHDDIVEIEKATNDMAGGDYRVLVGVL